MPNIYLYLTYDFQAKASIQSCYVSLKYGTVSAIFFYTSLFFANLLSALEKIGKDFWNYLYADISQQENLFKELNLSPLILKRELTMTISLVTQAKPSIY